MMLMINKVILRKLLKICLIIVKNIIIGFRSILGIAIGLIMFSLETTLQLCDMYRCLFMHCLPIELYKYIFTY